MSDERTEIETGIEGLLAPLKADGTLKTVASIGGQDYGDILRSAMGQAPFILIKYTGQVGEISNGEPVRYEAEVSLLIGVASLKPNQVRRRGIFEILAATKDALVGQRLGSDGAYYPLIMVREQWSEIAGGGLEVWEQRYRVRWEELYPAITGD